MHRLVSEHFFSKFGVVPVALFIFKQEPEALCYSHLGYQSLPAFFADFGRRQINVYFHNLEHLSSDEIQQSDSLNLDIFDPLELFHKNVVTTYKIIRLGFFGTGNMKGVHTHDTILLQLQSSLSNTIVMVNKL